MHSSDSEGSADGAADEGDAFGGDQAVEEGFDQAEN